MFVSIKQFFKRFKKSEKEESKSTAKERLHLVLAQDRANISADFLEMMKQEILEVIKKYIDIDEKAIDVRLTNKESEDGSVGAPALYANIPIITIKNEARKLEGTLTKKESSEQEQINESTNEENKEENDELKNENKEEKEEVNEEIEIDNKEDDDEKIKKGECEAENKIENEVENEQEDSASINVNEVDDEEKNS